MDAADITAGDLFTGEILIASAKAKALLPLHPGERPHVIGRSGLRHVPGNLHLTNYRLKFKARAPSGTSFTVFLPAIAGIANASRWLVRKVRISFVDGNALEFVMWGIPPFVDAVNAARARAGNVDWVSVTADARREDAKIGDFAVSAA